MMSIKDALLVEIKNFDLLELIQTDIFYALLSLILVVAVISEIVSGDGDSLGALRRTFSAIILVSLVYPLQTGLTEIAFNGADELLEALSGQGSYFGGESIIEHFGEYKKEVLDKEEGGGLFAAVGRFFGSVIFAPVAVLEENIIFPISRTLVMFSFVVSKVIYTCVFYLSLLLCVFPALISIIPFFKDSNKLVLSIILWLFIHPFMMAALVGIMDGVVASKILENGTYNSFIGIDTIFIILGFSLVILASLAMSLGIVNGTGIVEGVSKNLSMAGSMVGMSVARAGLGVATGGASAVAGHAAAGFLGGGIRRAGMNMSDAFRTKFSGSQSKVGKGVYGAGFVGGKTIQGIGKVGELTKGLGKGVVQKSKESFSEKPAIKSLEKMTDQAIATSDTRSAASEKIKSRLDKVQNPKTLESWAKMHKQRAEVNSDPSVQKIMKSEAAHGEKRAETLRQLDGSPGTARESSSQLNQRIVKRVSTSQNTMSASDAIRDELKREKSPVALRGWADLQEERAGKAGGNRGDIMRREADYARNLASFREGSGNANQNKKGPITGPQRPY